MQNSLNESLEGENPSGLLVYIVKISRYLGKNEEIH